MLNKKLLIPFLLILNLYGVSAMATENNLKLIGDFAESVFTKKDLTKVDHFIAKDYIQHNPLVEQGSEGFKKFFSEWFKAVPDFKYTLKNIIAKDDFVWVYGTYSGTQKGDWLGLPATNKDYKFDAVDIFRIENNKLKEHWDVLDVYGLFKQLGAIK